VPKFTIQTDTPWQVYVEIDSKPACIPLDANNKGYTVYLTGEVWVEWQGTKLTLDQLNAMLNDVAEVAGRGL
jgi:hypothetical protein